MRESRKKRRFLLLKSIVIGISMASLVDLIILGIFMIASQGERLEKGIFEMAMILIMCWVVIFVFWAILYYTKAKYILPTEAVSSRHVTTGNGNFYFIGNRED